MVTEEWGGELLRGECLTVNQIQKLKTQIDKIHARGEVHGDIFMKNVRVKRNNGKIVDVTLNDFGTIGAVETWRTILEASRQDFFYGNYMQNPENRQLFVDKSLSFEDVLRNPQILDNALVYYLGKTCL